MWQQILHIGIKGAQVWRVFSWLLILISVYAIAKGVYNVFFHPLSKFPGPKLFAASHSPLSYYILKGTLCYKIKDLHDQYGDVVRTAPNELSFSTLAAMQDILSKPGLPKNPRFYMSIPGVTSSVVAPKGNVNHRRVIAHAFSDRALSDQEPLIQAYIDQLILRLRETAGTPQDMVSWYNFTTFDIIGDLALGESFDCLANSKLHGWVSLLFKYQKVTAFRNVASRFPMISSILLPLIVSKSVLKSRQYHIAFTKEKVLKRLERETNRPDFMHHVLRHNTENGMSDAELISTFGVFLVAGSETTATLLSSVTFYLLLNPDVMAKLVSEIRGSFEKEEDITFLSVKKLKYQLAVLDEAMRIHPPAPSGTIRITPPQGSSIAGHWVPGDVTVYASSYTTSHVQANWANPDSFIPERWLGDGEYAQDKRETSAPFSLGPRDCVGRNLAYAEMRVVLARVLWNFNLKLDERSSKWDNMRMYNLWQKPPLFVTLTRVERD